MMRKKRLIIILAIIILLSSSIAFAQNIFEKIWKSNELTAKANSLVNKGKYDEAIEIFKEAIEIMPESGSTHYHFAKLYIQLGEKEKAISLLETYLEYVEGVKTYVNAADKLKCRELLDSLKENRPEKPFEELIKQ